MTGSLRGRVDLSWFALRSALKKYENKQLSNHSLHPINRAGSRCLEERWPTMRAQPLPNPSQKPPSVVLELPADYVREPASGYHFRASAGCCLESRYRHHSGSLSTCCCAKGTLCPITLSCGVLAWRVAANGSAQSCGCWRHLLRYNDFCAPVAQLDRANASEALGREFESRRAHHFLPRTESLAPKSGECSTQIQPPQSQASLWHR